MLKSQAKYTEKVLQTDSFYSLFISELCFHFLQKFPPTTITVDEISHTFAVKISR